MSASGWIATVIGGMAVAYLVHRVCKNGTKEERRRAKAITDATARRHEVLAPEEQKLADAWHEDIQDARARTDEYPVVPVVRKRHVYRPPSQRQLDAARARLLAPVRHFAADPLAAPIPGRHRFEEPELFGGAVEEWFARKAEPAFPTLPAEPEPWLLGGFTDTWSVGDVARMVERAKAEASR